MKIVSYDVKCLTPKESGSFDKYKINVQLRSGLIDRLFECEIQEKNRVLRGSCLYWSWEDGSRASYFWTLWAFRAIKKHKKQHSTQSEE